LIVDTGSAVTWIGAKKEYLKTQNSVDLHQHMEVHLENGIMMGYEYRDIVTFGDDVISQQLICDAYEVTNVFGTDGILGLGPVGLTRGTLENAPTMTVPTVTRNLYILGVIPEEVISIFFLPTLPNSPTYGEITFGGTNPIRYPGQIAYV